MAKNAYLYILRTGQGIRQNVLSKKLGFGVNYYTAVENGKSEGNIKFWKKIQEEFKVPDANMWDLINGRVKEV